MRGVVGPNVVDGERVEPGQHGFGGRAIVRVVGREEPSGEGIGGLRARAIERAADRSGVLRFHFLELLGVEERIAELLGDEGEHVGQVGAEGAAGEAAAEPVGAEVELDAAIFERLGHGEPVAVARPLVEHHRHQLLLQLLPRREVRPRHERTPERDDAVHGRRQHEDVGGAAIGLVDALGEGGHGGSGNG